MSPRKDSVSAPLAAAVASSAFFVPLLMSVGANPAPTNPRALVWYASLRKPWFKPPDIAIPLAWTAIESLLAFGAYRLLRSPAAPGRNRSLGLWAVNIFAIGGWNRLFFRHRDLPMATLAAVGLAGTATAYMVESKRVDKPAAVAAVPFVAWVGFASLLTASLWALNRR